MQKEILIYATWQSADSDENGKEKEDEGVRDPDMEFPL